MWANAKLFNRKETIYHQTAARMSALFERMWRDCGLQQAIARSRRANAGVPGRQAYEVALESPQPSARQPRSKSEGKKRRRDDDASAGSVRLASQARTGGTPARRAMSTDEIMAVAEGLQRAFAMETGADHVKAELMAVLQRANAIQEDEVDFEALDNSSLWDLKAILERL